MFIMHHWISWTPMRLRCSVFVCFSLLLFSDTKVTSPPSSRSFFFFNCCFTILWRLCSSASKSQGYPASTSRVHRYNYDLRHSIRFKVVPTVLKHAVVAGWTLIAYLSMCVYNCCVCLCNCARPYCDLCTCKYVILYAIVNTSEQNSQPRWRKGLEWGEAAAHPCFNLLSAPDDMV